MSTSHNFVPVQAPRESEAGRIVRVFVNPKLAFADIAARPRWWAPVVLRTVFSVLLVFAFSQRCGWEHFVRQQFDNSPAAQRMAPEERERAVQMQMKISPIFGSSMAVVGPVVGTVIWAGVLLFVFNTILRSAATYVQVLAVTAYAALPDVISMLGVRSER